MCLMLCQIFSIQLAALRLLSTARTSEEHLSVHVNEKRMHVLTFQFVNVGDQRISLHFTFNAMRDHSKS